MMNSPFFFSDAAIHALGWTLVHSLWQGAAAALLLWLIRPRLHTARQRYWVAFSALTAVLAAALVSFFWLYNPDTIGPASGMPVVAAAGMSDLLPVSAPAVPDFWETASGWLEAWHPVIVSIWLLGFTFFLVRLLGGLHFVYRLRSHQNRPADLFWQEKLESLAARLRYARPVQLLESALVQAPVALGFFKPLILLPLGLVNQLSPPEVEAILAHELSHIARRDWLFNLFQALVEALFYFHPAVWWISATIRAERENCCDDTAVDLTGNRLAYAKTLVRLQDLARTSNNPVLALGITGAVHNPLRRRPLLLERIKRILHQPQPSTSLMEKMIATAILLALITLWTLRANTPPVLVEAIREIAEKPAAWFAAAPQAETAFQSPADSLPKPKQKQIIVREDDDQKVEMELQDGQITRLTIDGKEIAEQDFPKYQKLTDEIRSESTPPAPPAPPVPPVPPVGWEVAPAPPAPDGIYGIQAPRAPRPPLGPTSRISTDKDDQGNTIIRLERNGKPVDITVKDGTVWIDGKKVEEGETIDLPPGDNQHLFWQGDDGQGFRLDGNRFFFQGPEGKTFDLRTMPELPEGFHFDGQNFNFDQKNFRVEGLDGHFFEFQHPELSQEEIMRIQEEALRGMKEQRREIENQLREQERQWKQNRREWDKNQKDQRRALEDARRSLDEAEKAQREALAQIQMRNSRTHADALQAEREALARVRVDKSRIEREARKARQADVFMLQHRDRAESASSVLKNALIRDNVITDPNNFSFELSGKSLRVNGKKQPEEVHKKYLELYRQRTGKELGKKDSIRVEEEN